MAIGILALQGDYASHAKVLSKLGVSSIYIREPKQLTNINGLIIPGGESTTMLKFFEEENFINAIQKFHQEGKAIFGTCAGAILLAKNVLPTQKSLQLIDITVERNAYGRQISSAVTKGKYKNKTIEIVLIRAPKIVQVGQEAKVLGWLDDNPICVIQKNVMVTTFHPELTSDFQIHKDFLALAEEGTKCQTSI